MFPAGLLCSDTLGPSVHVPCRSLHSDAVRQGRADRYAPFGDRYGEPSCGMKGAFGRTSSIGVMNIHWRRSDGAGAKKCSGPAPYYYCKELIISIL